MSGVRLGSLGMNYCRVLVCRGGVLGYALVGGLHSVKNVERMISRDTGNSKTGVVIQNSYVVHERACQYERKESEVGTRFQIPELWG